MKKYSFWGISLGLTLIILGCVGWVFSEPITHFFKYTFQQSKPSTSLQGVPRRLSYAGRIREAEKLMENKYFSLATVELQNAIREKPESITPYKLLGEIYIQTQDQEKLENLIQQIEKVFPESSETSVFRARKLISEKNFSEAVSILSNSEGEIPPSLKFYRAVLLALQNDHTLAQEILAELNTLPKEKSFTENEDSDEMNTLSLLLAKKVNDLLSAYADFSQLKEGKNPHLFALLGKILAQNNEAVLAKEFADIAIKEDIQYIDAWIVRGYAQLQMGDTEHALEDLRHAYELDPLRPQTHYFLALALHKSGKDDEAILFFEKSLQHNFEFSDEVRWKLVELFTQQKNYDRVIELYGELLDGNSEPDQYVNALHTAIDILKKPEIALEFAEKLIQEPNGETNVFALNMHGWALIANEKFIQAEKILQNAVRIDAENPRTFLNLALLREKQSRFLEAKEFYKKSYELGKTLDDSAGISITNLSAERYNELVRQIERPEEPEAPSKPENSP